MENQQMKENLHNFLKGVGSVFNVYPGEADIPPELQRFMQQPKTVEEAFLADAKAMHRDWERVGTSLRQAASRVGCDDGHHR